MATTMTETMTRRIMFIVIGVAVMEVVMGEATPAGTSMEVDMEA